MPFSADDLIRHILDEVAFLIAEASVMTEEQFMVDEKTQRAFARSLVWNTIQENIPVLGQQLKKLI